MQNSDARFQTVVQESARRPFDFGIYPAIWIVIAA